MLRKVPVGDWIGFFGLLFLAWMIAWIAMPFTGVLALALVIGVVSLRVGRKLDERAAERHRLAFDATLQHEALMEGYDDLGVYGRYGSAAPVIESRWGYPT